MKSIELKDFLEFTAVSDPKAAPAGPGVAWVTHRLDAKNDRYIHTLMAGDGKSMAEIPGANAGTLLWLDSDSFLCGINTAPAHGARIGRYSISTQELTPLFDIPVPGRILARLPGGCLLVMAAVNVLEQRRVSGKTGAELNKEWRAIESENGMCWVLDEFPFWQNGQGLTNKLRSTLYIRYPDGSLDRITDEFFDTACAAYSHETGEIYFAGAGFTREKEYLCGIYAYDVPTGRTRCLLEPGRYEIGGFGVHGRTIVFTACIQDGIKPLAQMHDLYTMDTFTGEMTILNSSELSFGNAVGTDASYGGGDDFCVREDGVYFLVSVEEHTELMRCTWQGVLQSVAVIYGAVCAFSMNDSRIVFTALKDMHLQECYELDKAGVISPLTGYNSTYCAEHDIIRPRRLRFINAEGNEIHGMVLLPPDAGNGKSHPAVLDIHGGPRASYGEVYYHEMQYWAHHGYYVLFCNPTGSLGRGQYFGDVCGKTGKVDFDDLMQFVDEALRAYPEIDPRRLGVTGGSYGGFMTNWIIGHTDRFAAAVSQRSTSNNISNEATTGNGPMFTRSCLAEGQTRSDELLWEQSPLKYADNAVTPTLFIHALEDYCCYHVEALQMYTALQRLGVDTRVCLFRHENHSLSRSGHPQARVRRLQEITGWLDKYLMKEDEI